MNNGQLQHFYPDFVPNQVLTNTQLNDLRTYLEQQTRLSRIRLTGCGIVCGLTWSVSDPTGGTGNERALTVHGGYGITSEGYFVDLEETEYTRYYTYTDPRQDEEEHPLYESWHTAPDDPSQIQLLALLEEVSEADEEITEEIHQLTSDALADKVPVLYLEVRDEELKSCLVTDCNNKGVKIALTVRVLLVNASDLEAVAPCESPEPPVRVSRLHAALEDLTLDEIESADQINRTYGKIVKDTWEPLAAQLQDAYDTYGIMLDVEEEVLELLEQTGTQIEEMSASSFHQYHYDFIKDLRAAYGEFLEAACPLIRPCFPASTFPRHLMLGALDGTDGYRTSFEPAPVRNVQNGDLRRTSRLFRRIFSLLAAFNEDPVEDIRITPSRTERRALGERAVPFYYGRADAGLSDEIQKLWQPSDCCGTDPLHSYHLDDGEAFDYGYANHSFLRIEGHLRGDCSDVVEQLETLKRAHNLEFDLHTVFLEGTNSEERELTQEMDELLERIEALWRDSPFWIRSITDLQQEGDEIDWQGDSPLQIRSTVTDLRSELNARYREWQKIRRSTGDCCDLSALQADYLEARTDLLGTYEQVFAYLDAVLDVLLRLPSLISERLPALFGEENMTSVGARVERRVTELDDEISVLETNLSEVDETTERAAIREELAAVRERRANISSLHETIRLSRAISRSVREAFVPGAEGEEGEREVPTVVLIVLFGLIQEIMRLRDTVHELIHYFLPRDLRVFNYHLFSREYRAVTRTTLELRLLPVFLALYGSALSRRDDLPLPPFEELGEFLEGASGESLGKGILEMLGGSEEEMSSLNPFTSRLITLVLRLVGALPYVSKLLVGRYHNRSLSRLATVYHTAEYVRTTGCHSFRGLVQRHSGLEHLAGVEPGGTFVLVCDRNAGEEGEVAADFSLHGDVECCCRIDPSEICLPPLAAPDYEIAVRPRPREDGESERASVDIHVMRNDFSLNEDGPESYTTGYERGLNVELNDQETEQGGRVALTRRKDDSVRPGWITYTNDRPDFYGLDRFTYTVTDERCEAATTGQVVVLVLPTFPFEEPEPTTGTVRGSVRDKETNAGIAGAEVAVRETDLGTTTGSKGDFRIDLAPGRYVLEASHPDYVSSSHAVEVTAGETEIVDIALTSEEEPVETGRLSVTVLDNSTGEGLTDYKHSARHTETGEQPSQVLIGGSKFIYNGLTPGPYELTVSKPGYGTFVKIVEVEPDTTRNVTARLKPIIIEVDEEKGQLSFQVVEVGMQEQPAPEVTLVVSGPGADNLECVTNVDGFCRTDTLRAGEYIVSIPERRISRTVSVLGGVTTEELFRLVTRASFALSREAPVVGWVAEVTGVAPEEARGGLLKLYNQRYSGYVRGVEQTSSAVQTSDEYLETARFLGGTIPQAEVPADMLDDRYRRTAGLLRAAVEQESDRADYRRILELSTWAYLDRWTTWNPSEVSQEAEERFGQLFHTLHQLDVDMTTFGERWRGGDLAERFQMASVKRLLELMNEIG